MSVCLTVSLDIWVLLASGMETLCEPFFLTLTLSALVSEHVRGKILMYVSEANLPAASAFDRLFSRARFHYTKLAPARALKGLRVNGFAMLYLC